MRRSFLWKGGQECRGINCLVNWERTCALKLNGGMGILDLNQQNEALLVKWIWQIENKPEGQWSQTLAHLYQIRKGEEIALRSDSSFFMKDLSNLIHFFNSSVRRGTDQTTLIWRWNSSGQFSCGSAYRAMHHTGICSEYSKVLWKMKTPMKVRIFAWLLLDNKLLTQEVLISRGCIVAQGCIFCMNGCIETINHFMWDCAYAKGFWRGLFAHYNLTWYNTDTIIDLWWNRRKEVSKIHRKPWDSIWAAGVWALWKERNRRTFSQKSKSTSILLHEATFDIHNWQHFA